MPASRARFTAWASVPDALAAFGALRPHPADVVLVLRYIGEMGEIAVGANDAHGLGDRHAVENGFEFTPRQLVLVAVKTDRGLTDILDQGEYRLAFLIAHGVAKDAAEQPDVLAQPGIGLLVSRIVTALGCGFFGGQGQGHKDAPGSCRRPIWSQVMLRRKTKLGRMDASSGVVPAKAGDP